MKSILFFLMIPILCLGQVKTDYEVSAEYPYGRLNPKAPKETADFAPLIGSCDCISTRVNPDQTWTEPEKMIWKWSYILNGFGVQDETVQENGSTSGSIRQFLPDSASWYVHYYSNPLATPRLPAWRGGKRGDSIVLYNKQKAPNGMDGFYRITFKDISEKGFNWIGEWVNTTETFSFPTWKIQCVKRDESSEVDTIKKHVKAFSEAYMRGDAQAIADMYTMDGKLFPGGSDIISGRDAIKARWDFVANLKQPYHKVTPSEIKIIDNYAYDYGYYEGSSINEEGAIVKFKGKYVIVWRKVAGDWKIYLDIWNRL